MESKMTKKNKTSAALAVILATGMAGTAFASPAYPTSTDEARRAAAQRSISFVDRSSPAPVAPATTLDELRAAAGREQAARASSISSASKAPLVVTSLDEARAAIAAGSNVEAAPVAPAPVEQARALRASGKQGRF
jgi:hypothetical protein